jgi:hypothetical protein
MNNQRELTKTWPYLKYKPFRKTVSSAASIWFQSKGFKTNARKSYSLVSRDQWRENIILPEVVRMIEAEKDKAEKDGEAYALHEYLHNGLSSQSMLFNLIGPLKTRLDFEPLKLAFSEIGLPWPTGQVTCIFEETNREIFNEQFGQPTSIDFVLRGSDDCPPLFIESKFVEQEFGGCSVFKEGDCDGRNPISNPSEICYLSHIDRKYWDLMVNYGFIPDHIVPSPLCLLSIHYQFFREVIYALEQKGYFILLYDERNPTFYSGKATGRGLMPFLLSLTPTQLHEKIKSISIQQIVKTIEASSKHQDWIHEFKNKYGIGC